jgi:lysophospholipid acyltransferase (LPLAT)-like uncharacterized protein
MLQNIHVTTYYFIHKYDMVCQQDTTTICQKLWEIPLPVSKVLITLGQILQVKTDEDH